MGYVFLVGAIVFEVIATSFLKLTSGDRAVWWALPIVGIGYLAAFGALSLSLSRGIPLGIAYAIWSGLGVVLVVVVSRLVFKELLCPMQIGGMVLVIGGVLLLELGAHH